MKAVGAASGTTVVVGGGGAFSGSVARRYDGPGVGLGSGAQVVVSWLVVVGSSRGCGVLDTLVELVGYVKATRAGSQTLLPCVS